MPTVFRLRRILEVRQISQRELSRLSGVSMATINRMCTNATRQASLHSLDRLAKALAVEPGDLLAHEKGRAGRR
jgi:DNA-binding Xre family transcriptional regulator